MYIIQIEHKTHNDIIMTSLKSHFEKIIIIAFLSIFWLLIYDHSDFNMTSKKKNIISN